MKSWVFLFLAIIGEIIGTSTLKASEGFTHPISSIICVVSFLIALFFLSLTLKTIPMGIAYAVWSGVGIVLISLIGFFVFKQSLDIPGFIGIALILIGVLVMHMFSKTIAH